MRKIKKSKIVKNVCLLVALCSIITVQPVFATGAGADVISNGFNGLMEIVKAFVSSIGAIIVLWGLLEWGSAMQSNDGMMQSMAFKRIGGGLVMVLGPQILAGLIS